MTTYVEYELDHHMMILIELLDESASGVVPASRKVGELAKIQARKSLKQALIELRAHTKLLMEEIEALHVDEAEVKFGVNTVGELGSMAIGKVGLGVNYEVTLKWKKPPANIKNSPAVSASGNNVD